MKKFLVITTHFAPDRHPGAKRVTKFAKHLPAFNWEPYIITKPIAEYEGIDESLEDELTGIKYLYRVPTWGVKKKTGFKKTDDGVSELQSHRDWSFFQLLFRLRLVQKIVVFIENLDLMWILPAVLMSIRIVKKEKISVVYNSAPDHGTHLIGLFLKLLLRKKWICEFRDPWTILHDHFKPLSNIQRRTDIYIERSAIEKSDALIAIGRDLMVHLLRNSNRRNPNFVIHNGYDKEDFKFTIEPPQCNKFTMVHLGTFATKRTPFRFIEAISKLTNSCAGIEDSLCINFFGGFRHNSLIEIEEKTKKLIKENGLNNIFKLSHYIGYRQGLRELIQSQVSLLIERPEEKDNDNKWVVTSKLFQYLYAKRPILALVPANGEAARIIKECGAGEIADPEDVNAIADKIYQMYTDWKENKLRCYNFNVDEVAKYDRQRQVKQLAEILNSLTVDS